MSTVRESIDVSVPVHIAYERLCHFEDYPQFMQGVQEVTQVSDDLAHWVMDLDGTTTEFNARSTRSARRTSRPGRRPGAGPGCGTRPGRPACGYASTCRSRRRWTRRPRCWAGSSAPTW